MAACREGFNLCNKIQRQNFFSKKRKPWKLMLEDTLLPWVCRLLGHKPYRPDKINDPKDWACKRCHQWLDLNGKI